MQYYWADVDLADIKTANIKQSERYGCDYSHVISVTRTERRDSRGMKIEIKGLESLSSQLQYLSHDLRLRLLFMPLCYLHSSHYSEEIYYHSNIEPLNKYILFHFKCLYGRLAAHTLSSAEIFIGRSINIKILIRNHRGHASPRLINRLYLARP